MGTLKIQRMSFSVNLKFKLSFKWFKYVVIKILKLGEEKKNSFT
jgi:hypothetical protein